MLMAGPYPYSLKQRVSGRFGHLDNASAGSLLRRLRHGGLKHVIAAHLSRQNNTPLLARQAFADVLGVDLSEVGIACQDQGFDWRSL
jgi:phosphoribosyl 1,2-cyclic phosphodiesterase